MTVSRSLRSVLALNNVGTALLERGCYRDAATVLKSALSLARTVLVDAAATADNAQPETVDSHNGEEDSMLNDAYKLLAQSSSAVSPPSVVQMGLASFDGVSISTKATKGITKFQPSRFFAVPIRLDLVQYSELEDIDPDIMGGIIIYNYGIAHACLSRFSATIKSARRHEDSTLQLFKAAFHALYKKATETDMFDGCNELYILILSHLVQTLIARGDTVEANFFFQIMTQIRTDIELEAETGVLSIFEETTAPAA